MNFSEILVGILILLLIFAVCKQAISPNREDTVEGREFRVLNMADVMHKDTAE
jgi:hypothetical protein